jgi:hypothetical protein
MLPDGSQFWGCLIGLTSLSFGERATGGLLISGYLNCDILSDL